MTAAQHPTVWLTGLSGAGKTSIALALAQALKAQGCAVALLDGDQLRHGLNRDLGFTPQDRHENIRRTAEVARLMNAAGLTVIAAFISPYRADRAMAADIIGAAHFIEVTSARRWPCARRATSKACMRRRARDGSRSSRAFPRPTKHRWTRR